MFPGLILPMATRLDRHFQPMVSEPVSGIHFIHIANQFKGTLKLHNPSTNQKTRLQFFRNFDDFLKVSLSLMKLRRNTQVCNQNLPEPFWGVYSWNTLLKTNTAAQKHQPNTLRRTPQPGMGLVHLLTYLVPFIMHIPTRPNCYVLGALLDASWCVILIMPPWVFVVVCVCVCLLSISIGHQLYFKCTCSTEISTRHSNRPSTTHSDYTPSKMLQSPWPCNAITPSYVF